MASASTAGLFCDANIIASAITFQIIMRVFYEYGKNLPKRVKYFYTSLTFVFLQDAHAQWRGPTDNYSSYLFSIIQKISIFAA